MSITGNYNVSLFCINRGQKNYSNLSFKKTRIIMENLFPKPTKYELFNYTELPSIAFDIISEMEKNTNENRENNKEMKRELESPKKKLESLLLFFLILMILKLLNLNIYLLYKG